MVAKYIAKFQKKNTWKQKKQPNHTYIKMETLAKCSKFQTSNHVSYISILQNYEAILLLSCIIWLKNTQTFFIQKPKK